MLQQAMLICHVILQNAYNVVSDKALASVLEDTMYTVLEKVLSFQYVRK